MGKFGKQIKRFLLPILLIIVLFNLFFVTSAQAAFNYSNSNGNFSLSFDSVDDLSGCSNINYWVINLAYNDEQTQVKGGVHEISTTSATDSFNIAEGTAIELIQVWTGETSDAAQAGACTVTVANNGDGIFTWDAGMTISNILVSNVTSSSVTVSWTTDEAADSVVQYGTTTSYGSTASDGTGTTSHSISLTGLSASSTYHYKVKSGSTESGDNTFATPASGQTGSNQSGSSSSSSSTPTPTPVPDTTGPSISLATDFSKPYVIPPLITGSATDTTGVARIEYSLDDGRNWNDVDKATNLGGKSVSFSFTPAAFDDDNYLIKIRATDLASAQNVGTSKTYTLIIDRLPPSLIGNVISVGPQVIFPTTQGYLLTSKGIQQKITITSVGGPTKIELSAYPPGATESAQIYSLQKNPESGLWSGTLQFNTPGIYELASKSTDGAGNITEQKLNSLAVLEPGKILSNDNKSVKDAKVTVYYFEEKYQIWRVWDGNSYYQKNPQKTDTSGEFSYLLPSGKYYFDVRAPGFQNVVSEIFLVEQPTILNPVFKLKPLTLLLNLGFFKIYLPDFSIATVPVAISAPPLPPLAEDMTGKVAAQISLPTTEEVKFDLFATRGSPVLLTFMNVLSPQSYEQLTSLDQLTQSGHKPYAIMLGNTLSKTTILKQTGGFKTPFVVDTDAKLVNDYQLTTLPTHFFLDRRGVIRKVIPGILNKQEMEETLLEIQ